MQERMTAPQRWEPDAQLVPAVLSTPKSPRPMHELSIADRAWLVAGLTEAGITAQDIATRTGCSLRLVRAIRAEPITQLCVLFLRAEQQAETEIRGERCDHALTRRELTEAQRENQRLRVQLDQIIDAHLTGRLTSFRCGHPKVPYNTYRHGGTSYCRQCRTDRQARRRASLVSVGITCAVVSS